MQFGRSWMRHGSQKTRFRHEPFFQVPPESAFSMWLQCTWAEGEPCSSVSLLYSPSCTSWPGKVPSSTRPRWNLVPALPSHFLWGKSLNSSSIEWAQFISAVLDSVFLREIIWDYSFILSFIEQLLDDIILWVRLWETQWWIRLALSLRDPGNVRGKAGLYSKVEIISPREVSILGYGSSEGRWIIPEGGMKEGFRMEAAAFELSLKS